MLASGLQCVWGLGFVTFRALGGFRGQSLAGEHHVLSSTTSMSMIAHIVKVAQLFIATLVDFGLLMIAFFAQM